MSQRAWQAQDLHVLAHVIDGLGVVVANMKGSILAISRDLKKSARVWSAYQGAVGDLNLLQALVGTSNETAVLSRERTGMNEQTVRGRCHVTSEGENPHGMLTFCTVVSIHKLDSVFIIRLHKSHWTINEGSCAHSL